MGVPKAGAKLGVTLRWPEDWRRLGPIERSGRCPSYCVPRKVPEKDVTVALVARDGRVLLIFELARIEKNQTVRGADGLWYDNGCVLVARRGTMRRPRSSDPKRLVANSHGDGSPAYFEVESRRPHFFEPGTGETTSVVAPLSRDVHSPPVFVNNAGKHLSQPERALVTAYRTWTRKEDAFETGRLKGSDVCCDLFLRPKYVLIEAKASLSTEVLRGALGQLFDYQRYFNRHPRLALLLPARPSKAMQALFESKRITVIWQTRGGKFRDSDHGSLTSELRRS